MQTPTEQRLQKIRRLNLLKLIDDQGGGTVVALLKAYGLSPSFQSGISRYVTMGTKTAMPMGWRAARNLEKRLGLPDQALDQTTGIEWQVNDEATEEEELPPAVESLPAPVQIQWAASAKRPELRLAGQRLSPGVALAQAVRDVAGVVPAERRDIVASLVSTALSTPQAVDVLTTLLAEEIEKHIKK